MTAGCPVPIVMAGGKKLPELEALEMAYRAVQDGAAGVDMGRNIFQSESPAAMIQAVAKVVHDGARPGRRTSCSGSSPCRACTPDADHGAPAHRRRPRADRRRPERRPAAPWRGAGGARCGAH